MDVKRAKKKFFFNKKLKKKNQNRLKDGSVMTIKEFTIWE